MLALPINPNDLAFLRDVYTDPTVIERGAYEMAYYAAFGELPSPTSVIDYVEVFDNGRRMWTHHERFTPCMWAVGADNHGDQHVWPYRLSLKSND